MCYYRDLDQDTIVSKGEGEPDYSSKPTLGVNGSVFESCALQEAEFRFTGHIAEPSSICGSKERIL